MCGIIGAVAQRDVAAILIEGLKRLEYRGYDSAGIVVIGEQPEFHEKRVLGKVRELANTLEQSPLNGRIGMAHTRWATHGKPSEQNAHPHFSGKYLAIVHNGIIENHEELRRDLITENYQFHSDTDTEVVVHLVHATMQKGHDLLQAVQQVIPRLKGAFSLGFMCATEPNRLIAVRSGSPLVIGLGIGENFIASDHIALLPVAQKFIYLEDGDVVDLKRDSVVLYNQKGEKIQRDVHVSEMTIDVVDKGAYRHYMMKEIMEQPKALETTLEGRMTDQCVLDATFGIHADLLFDRVKHVQIVACGTSYHAGMVARYWFEEIAGIACSVEVASEFRYRKKIVNPDTLFITISQSGETADTLSALRQAKQLNYLACLSISNVAESSIVRESDLVLLTRAGIEIGVASTKAFTAQLVSLLLLTLCLGRRHGLSAEREMELVKQLKSLPALVQQVLGLSSAVEKLAQRFLPCQHALFLGRGTQYPVALEGALKLKELSYIHAEAYPAGELKHGPLALVDKDMPVVAVAQNDLLLEKLKSNLYEVKARGGALYLFADQILNLDNQEDLTVIPMPSVDSVIAPIVYTIPLQLLAYYVAVLKGTDVDQPRNLAKSVTVE